MDYHLEEHGRARGRPQVTVAISLHNYRKFIVEALDSVAGQTLRPLSLVVVDDASSDDGAMKASRWMRRHGSRFVRATLLRCAANAGLASARNLGLEFADAPLFFVLDADNTIYPRCLDRLAAALAADRRAVMAYCILEKFGDETGLLGTPVWDRNRLAAGNYIDAMSLLRTARLREAGGYARMRVMGWEDFELWCRLAERGFHGVRVPEILARYRVHGRSMLNTETRRKERAQLVIAEMLEAHPWLRISLDKH